MDSLGTGSSGVGERRLVTMIVDHPELLDAVAEEFATVDIANRELDRVRRAILEMAPEDSGLDSEALKRHLSAQGISISVERVAAPVDWSERHLEDELPRREASCLVLEREWRDVLALHQSGMLDAELRAAYEMYEETRSEEALERFNALRRRVERRAGDKASLGEFDSPPGHGNAA